MGDFNLESDQNDGVSMETPDALRDEGLGFDSPDFPDGRVTGSPGSEVFEFDGKKFIDENYGSTQNFLDAQPDELRRELGLPRSASSEDVYKKMAGDTADILTTASAEMKQEILESLDIKMEDATESNILAAMIRRDSREFGLNENASFEELESAIHQRSLKEIESGKLPIDYN